MKTTMHHFYSISIIVLIGLLLTTSCGIQKPGPGQASAPVVIYKTRQDYRDLVSVQLSEDGRSVSAFPAPSDVRAQRPVELAAGYLLKRMPGNAFLSLSIEEYAGNAKIYTGEELFDLIIDRQPYLEIYDCSVCSSGDTASLNLLIRQARLKECRALR